MNFKDVYKEALEAKKEKHNKTYHQDEPVPFKKPTEAESIDKEPKAEPETQKVLDRMKDQSEISTPSSTDFFKKLRDAFQDCINVINNADEGKDRADK